MTKRIISIALRAGVTLLLFTLLFRPHTFGLSPAAFGGVTPRQMLAELQDSPLGRVAVWLLFAAVVKLTGMMAGVMRWRLLLIGQGLRMPFSYLVQSWFVGRYFGIVLPSTLGLDGYRLYDSARETGDVVKCATVIVIEKLIGFISLTFLVFLTFPLGFRLLNVNVAVLSIILFVLGSFVAVAFTFLLTPRVIQVLVSIIPAPEGLRRKINHFGAAVTAYSGHKPLLLAAVGCGLLVHLGTCFMFFGTMMALRSASATTSLLDILFASPLMIYGTVIGPSIGGEGIREIVFVSLLANKSSAAAAATFAHLGWWVGELAPALIGSIVYIMRSRASRDEVRTSFAAMRERMASTVPRDEIPSVGREDAIRYRNLLVSCLLAGCLGGLLAGAITGVADAMWVVRGFHGMHEWNVLWWGPMAYGLASVGLGAGLAGVAAFFFLVFDRFAPAAAVWVFSLGGSVSAGGFIVGLFRYKRGVAADHALAPSDYLTIIALALCAGLLAMIIVTLSIWLPRKVRPVFLWIAPVITFIFFIVHALGADRLPTSSECFALIVLAICASGVVAVFGGLGLWMVKKIHPQLFWVTPIVAFLLIIFGGMASSVLLQPANTPVPTTGKAAPGAPNIILIAADALRADVLRLYGGDKGVPTPALEQLAKDGVLFRKCFAQASWTKPSFATMFSGLYPESHTATGQQSMLPQEITTFPELLQKSGYFTQGFANNPNVAALFGFDQGFSNYTDLERNLLLGASPSASRLAIYEFVRRAHAILVQKIFRRMDVRDAYQPGDTVTKTALDWMDGTTRPKEAPFFLFLHYMDPHDPFMDHDKPGVGYARATNKNPDPERFLEPMLHAYRSEVDYMDKQLAGLFDGLRQRGLYDNSIIAFVSDHGEEFQEHKGWWHGQTLYDEVLHVPLILKLPGNKLAGSESTALARHIDLAPTFMRWAGAAPAPEMTGRALASPEDTALSTEGPAFVYSHNDFEGFVLHSVRTQDAKLIESNAENTRAFSPTQLFDLGTDAAEQKNLAGQNDIREPDMTRTLQGMKDHVRGRAAEPSMIKEITDEEKDRLKAVGYM